MIHIGWSLLKRAPLLLALFSFSALAQNVTEVRIENYKYFPAEIRIKTGDSVRWVNHEKRTSHSVVFPVENGLESERMFPDESWLRRIGPVHFEHVNFRGTIAFDMDPYTDALIERPAKQRVARLQ